MKTLLLNRLHIDTSYASMRMLGKSIYLEQLRRYHRGHNMTLMTKLLSIMNRRILSLINITVRSSELRPRKTTTNYGYAFEGTSQKLRWTSTDCRQCKEETTDLDHAKLKNKSLGLI